MQYNKVYPNLDNLTRPLRIEFAGAVYHITSRGNAQQAIFLAEKDLADFLLVPMFFDRYQAILVDKDNCLLELCRYVVLNPIRAKIVTRPQRLEMECLSGNYRPFTL